MTHNVHRHALKDARRIVVKAGTKVLVQQTGRPDRRRLKLLVDELARFRNSGGEVAFVSSGAVGAGLFAVNPAGRARWGDFPAIISDDTFVRLQFAPGERIEVPARYHWPMVEGFSNLVRVRRRQDAGVTELHRLHPELFGNEGKAPVTAGVLWRLARTVPLGLAVYLAVHVAVRLRPASGGWTRGR